MTEKEGVQVTVGMVTSVAHVLTEQDDQDHDALLRWFMGVAGISKASPRPAISLERALLVNRLVSETPPIRTPQGTTELRSVIDAESLALTWVAEDCALKVQGLLGVSFPTYEVGPGGRERAVRIAVVAAHAIGRTDAPPTTLPMVEVEGLPMLLCSPGAARDMGCALLAAAVAANVSVDHVEH